MADGFLTISDGTFSLQETKVPNQFYFFRNDGGKIGEVGRMPIEFYQEYIVNKMMRGEIRGTVACNIRQEILEDRIAIRLTAFESSKSQNDSVVKEEKIEEENLTKVAKPNVLRRMIKKIFG